MDPRARGRYRHRRNSPEQPYVPPPPPDITPAFYALQLICAGVEEDEDRLVTSRERRWRAIRAFTDAGVPVSELAAVTGLSDSFIRNIKAGKNMPEERSSDVEDHPAS